MGQITIGIPRGMLYYEFYPMWQGYFRSLNFTIKASPRTNKKILDKGILSCVDEACLPVKIFHGHVEYLKDKIDYLFIPKIMSLYKKEYCCPKILGLPEMIKHSVKDCPKIIDTELNLNKRKGFEKGYIEIGELLGVNRKDSLRAYKEGLREEKNYLNWLKTRVLNNSISNKFNNNISILILGHSYNVYDDFINMGIIKKLVENGVNIRLPEEVTEKEVRYHTNMMPKRLFWTHGRRTVGAAYSFIDKGQIDGIIYLNSFGCGLDSVLTHLVSRKSKENSLPIMELTLDEQTGEAGFNTRLEAFLDMMKWRFINEDNISSSR